MAEMGINTYDIDKAAYQQERMQFLQDQAAFRSGAVAAGVLALAHLKSMYHTLWYRKHLDKNAESARNFIKLIATTEDDLIRYAKNNMGIDKVSMYDIQFRRVIVLYESVTEAYQRVLIDCEVK